MKNINTAYETVIAKAVKEAGINENEKYNVILTGNEGRIVNFVIDTEWNKVTCYADIISEEVVGIMAEAKMVEEILWGPSSVVAAASANSFRAA